MPKRPPTLAERLRTAWSRTGDHVLVSAGGLQQDRSHHKGTHFADRLRAAVRTR